MQARKRLVEAKYAEESELEIKARVQAELGRLQEMNELEKRVRQCHAHITETILNLSCPRCEAAYFDFTGCAAVKCSRCNCGFCGYCRKDCGDDAHAHVPQCRHGNGGGLFPAPGHLDAVLRHQRQTRVAEYLSTLNQHLRDETLDACAHDLEDLGIHIPRQLSATEEHSRLLLEMGFEEADVTRALEVAGGELDRAVAFLVAA
jgi:hypothetical protein